MVFFFIDNSRTIFRTTHFTSHYTVVLFSLSQKEMSKDNSTVDSISLLSYIYIYVCVCVCYCLDGDKDNGVRDE